MLYKIQIELLVESLVLMKRIVHCKFSGVKTRQITSKL